VLQVFKRNVVTNQRIYFDLYKDLYLCSGNNDGNVSIWNAEKFDMTQEYEPILTDFKASKDCINGVSFNPIYPLLATTSGQRKFFQKNDTISSSDSENESESPIFIENKLKIWKHYL
jgi:hypothetical protein